jgi:heme a synthase
VKITRGLLRLLVILQAGLILTGGAVRLTGSGLGCPTWPRCTPGSYTPVPHQAQGALHSWIEFGNRLLTFVLILTALAVFIAIIRARAFLMAAATFRHIFLLAVGQVLGILAQGVLGGITVLTHLNPLPVAAHFLLSIWLITGALSLQHRILLVGRVDQTELDAPVISQLIRIIILLTTMVIAVGTVVTGSGPHAGDISARRFPFDPRTVSWLHADLVIALVAITLVIYLLLRNPGVWNIALKRREILERDLRRFILVIFAQGAIGYIQYFTHLPEGLVAIHLLGVTLVWIAIWSLKLNSRINFIPRWNQHV